MNNLTIRNKLFAGFGLVLIMMIVLTIVGIRNVNFIDDTLTQISDVNSVKQRYAIDYRGSVHDRAIDIRDVVLAGNKAKLQSLKTDIENLAAEYLVSETSMQKMRSHKGVFNEQETTILTKINDIQEKTLPQIALIINYKEQGDIASATALLSSETGDNFKQWLNTINEFIDYQEQANKIATPLARDVAGSFQYLMLIITSIAIFISAGVIMLVSRSITKQLGAEPSVAASALANMTAGDLATPINNCCPTSLMGSVSTMRDKLSLIVASIVDASKQLSSQTQIVTSASGQVYDSAKLQAKLTEDAMNHLSTMRDGLANVTESVTQSEKNSEETSQFAKLGKDKVNESAKEMEHISSTVNETVDQIKQLESKTKEIGSIISVISAISDQTNLLALNAAIEAARAGDTGRGFAVVADEVRQLALRTSEATREIEDMIGQVQNETAQSVLAMEKTQPLVENGRELTNETTDLLINIEKQAKDSLINVHEVTLATQEQEDFVNKVTAAMDEINQMSAESISALQQNNEVTLSLDSLSKELKNTVGFFNLG